MKPKRKKRSPLAIAKSKADKLMQEIGRKENDYCLVCGGEYNCLHHYITKGASFYLRYDFRNLIPVCVGCHFKIHQTNDPNINFIIVQKKGKKWHEEIQSLRGKIKKNNLTEIKKLQEKLQEKLDNI